MKIAIGNDHSGVEMKNLIMSKFKDEHEFIDCGVDTTTSVDYPDYSKIVCEKVLAKEVDFGILICGTGIGMSVAANRFPGIRAALCFHSLMAKLARHHNNSNILCLGARMIGHDVAIDCVETFMENKFDGGRHERRIEKIESSC